MVKSSVCCFCCGAMVIHMVRLGCVVSRRAVSHGIEVCIGSKVLDITAAGHQARTVSAPHGRSAPWHHGVWASQPRGLGSPWRQGITVSGPQERRASALERVRTPKPHNVIDALRECVTASGLHDLIGPQGFKAPGRRAPRSPGLQRLNASGLEDSVVLFG